MTEPLHAHVDERAELYALGALDAAEARALETHVAHCAECRRRVGEAEEAVLVMDGQFAPMPPPASLASRVRASRTRAAGRGVSWYALAAACVVLLLPSLVLLSMLMQARDTERVHAAATLAMVNSHFAHAQFAALRPAAPHAKAVFARDGSWVYVIVDAPRSFGVALEANGSRRTAGATRVYGNASEFFTRNVPKGANAVYLRDDAGNDVARAAMLPGAR